MNKQLNNNFGSTFERYLVSFLAFSSALILIYLSINGPFFLNQIHYKTSFLAIYQFEGQDLINLFLISPILIISAITLIFRKEISKYLIILTPLYLIYFVISYTIGLEWSSSTYSGNSENYSFHFLFILISALILLLYALNIFPKTFQNSFKRKSLILYSILFIFFILAFSSMWIKEIFSVIQTGSIPGYKEAPTGFWAIRMLDLGFSIPVGLISVYLLWTRPNESCSLQFMFYGFFITMLSAVNSMGIVMYINNDPTFRIGSMFVFMILILIVLTGFIFIVKNLIIIQKQKN